MSDTEDRAISLTNRSHFWDDGENAHDSIRAASELGPSPRSKDVVRVAWKDILDIYFPNHLDRPVGIRYRVHTGAPRGPPGREGETRADVVVVQIATSQRGVEPVKRDVLWVECGTPEEDQPKAWNKLMKQAVGRLTVAHPSRNIHLVLAIGIQWMLFEWAPGNQRSPLQICAHSLRATWSVHPQIHVPIPDAPYLVPSNLNVDYDQIDTTRAYSLDFWTLDPTRQQPSDRPALYQLESCLGKIQVAVFLGGPNPAHFLV